MERFFATDGIRVVANEHPVTAHTACSLGRALVKAPGMKMGACAPVGRDTRGSGRKVVRRLVRHSGTENEIRVPVGHHDTDTAARWAAKFSETTAEEIG